VLLGVRDYCICCSKTSSRKTPQQCDVLSSLTKAAQRNSLAHFLTFPPQPSSPPRLKDAFGLWDVLFEDCEEEEKMMVLIDDVIPCVQWSIVP